MSDKAPAWWVLDIETVVDEELVLAVEGESLVDFRSRLAEKHGVKDPWIPTVYHRPVEIAIAFLGSGLGIQRLVSVDGDGPEELSRRFWKAWAGYAMPRFATWNGRGFDLPVLEVEAFRAGLSVPRWFKIDEKAWIDPRSRYNQTRHVDLKEEMGNRGGARIHGGLNLAARLAGFPGKVGTGGGDVAGMMARGETRQVRGYCMTDVLNTWGVLLRWGQLLGWEVNGEELLEAARPQIAELAEDHPETLGLWLEAMS